MIPLINEKSVFRSPLAVYTLGAAFVFILGFFIHFGMEAHNTKSWKQVMPLSDASFYWNVAKGRMMTPRCDGNPYYYEEQGTRHGISCFTAEAIGLIAKYTGIPISWFFPAWYILMPLATWFAIVLCCWKFWKYPLGVSAAVSLALLLSCMFFKWPIWEVLSRFSRPMDGVAPLFLWITLIFKGDPASKKHCWAIGFISALVLWIQPFYAVFGLWITGLEYLWVTFRERSFLKARLHLFAIASVAASGIFYFLYAYYGKDIVRTIGQGDFPLPGTPAACFLAALSMLVFFAAAVFFLGPFLRKSITALDRLVLEWAFFGVAIYGIIGPSKKQVAQHMCYFLMIMIFSLTGWLYEKISVLKGARFFSRLNIFFVIAALSLFIISDRFFYMAYSHYFGYVSRYFLALLFFTCLFAGIDFLRKWVLRKAVVCGAILILAVAGYSRLPLNYTTRDFPFSGVYEWMEKNARKNEVVLIASVNSGANNPLFFDTGLKPYWNEWGDILSRNPADADYRYFFSRGLLLNLLPSMPSTENWTLDQKLHFFRLDYILIPLPSPFYEAIVTQLGGRLNVVYQDKRCLLWRVS